jgi:hypothetical protein
MASHEYRQAAFAPRMYPESNDNNPPQLPARMEFQKEPFLPKAPRRMDIEEENNPSSSSHKVITETRNTKRNRINIYISFVFHGNSRKKMTRKYENRQIWCPFDSIKMRRQKKEMSSF